MTYFRNMKMKSNFVILIFSVLVSLSAMSKSNIPDFYSVNWVEQKTKVELPEPFNEVTIKINKSNDRFELEDVVLTVGGKEIRFGGNLIKGIENISGPEFSYGRTDFDDDKEIDSFDIYFEYGYPKLIDLGEVPGCKSPCTESVRDIVVFTVDKHYKVVRKFK